MHAFLVDSGDRGILASAFRVVHVLDLSTDEIAQGFPPVGGHHRLACGLEQEVFEDIFKEYDRPFFPWWWADLASCRECLEVIDGRHDLYERQQAREAARQCGCEEDRRAG